MSPARNWEDLKQILGRHRFFVHTAEASLKDGYNMAMLEATAAGPPVRGNRHPTSPIRHGIDGFLSDDPAQWRAWQSIDHAKLAQEMGAEVTKNAAELFAVEKFNRGVERSIETARRKWPAACNVSPPTCIEA